MMLVFSAVELKTWRNFMGLSYTHIHSSITIPVDVWWGNLNSVSKPEDKH